MTPIVLLAYSKYSTDPLFSEMKLFLNARARFVAESFLTPVSRSLFYLSRPSANKPQFD
jgi:hypothetical protein